MDVEQLIRTAGNRNRPTPIEKDNTILIATSTLDRNLMTCPTLVDISMNEQKDV